MPIDDGKAASAELEPEGSAEEWAEQERRLRALGYVVDEDVPEAGESSPEIHNNLGRIQLAKGALDAAQREFEQALALDPSNADALLNMGTLRRVLMRRTGG